MSDSNPAVWLPLHRLKSPRFISNLAYLSAFDPALYQKLQNLETQETFLIQQSEGLIRCRDGGDPPRWIFGEESPRRELAVLQEELRSIAGQNGLLVILGGAAGYALQCLSPLFLRNAEQRLLLIETSPPRLALCLHAVDARPALATGRMHLALSQPTREGILDALDRFNLWDQSPLFFFTSPEYRDSISEADVEPDFFLNAQRVKRERIELMECLRNRAPQSVGINVKRVLLVDFWPGAPQSLHVRSIYNAMRERTMEAEIYGLEGFRFDLYGAEYRRLVKWNFLAKIRDFQPDLIVSYAYHAPHLLTREEFASLRTPWVQAVSNLVYFDQTYYSNEYSGIAERRLLPSFRNRGALHPFFLPIMANYVADRPTPTSRVRKIVFVGNALDLPAREIEEYLLRIQRRSQLRNYLREAERTLSDFDGGVNLFDYLEQNPIPEIEGEKDYHDVFRYLLCQSTGARRRILLESIAPFGLSLYGNWSNLLENSPLKDCLRGAIPFQQEPALFREGHIFLNIHTVANASSPNMRFFNVAGMGGFMIGDGDFNEYLTPGVDYIQYSSRRELIDFVRFYLDHIVEADGVRQNALERIQRQWTYRHWVDRVLKELS